MGVWGAKEKGPISPLKGKRRDQLNILADILNITREPALKTQIMYRANLKFTQLNRYLNFLLNTKMIALTTVDGKELYKITAAGENFLHKHDELLGMLKTQKNVISVKFPLDGPMVNWHSAQQRKATR